MNDNIETRPEAKLARTCYKFSFVPVFGLLVYIIFAPFAIIEMRKGVTGFNTLKKGGIVALLNIPALMLLFTIVGNIFNWQVTYALGFYYWERNYHSDGTLYREITYVFWYRHGKYCDWDDNGEKKEVEGNYNWGKKHGKWTAWCDNLGSAGWDGHDILRCDEKYKEEGYYENDITTKPWITYYDNGQKAAEGKRVKSFDVEARWGRNPERKNKIGKWTYWDKDGNKIQEEFYNEEAELERVIVYKNNKPTEEVFGRGGYGFGASPKAYNFFNTRGELTKTIREAGSGIKFDTIKYDPPKKINWDTYIKKDSQKIIEEIYELEPDK